MDDQGSEALTGFIGPSYSNDECSFNGKEKGEQESKNQNSGESHFGISRVEYCEKILEELQNGKIIDNNNNKISGCSWAKSTNAIVSEQNSTNTAEVLLAMLYSTSVISLNKIQDIEEDINGAVQYLLNVQCATGGWASSEFYTHHIGSVAYEIKGNLMATAIVIWALTVYYCKYSKIRKKDINKLREAISKSYGFIKNCKSHTEPINNEQLTIYNYRSDDKISNISISTLIYALLALVQIDIVIDGGMCFSKNADSESITKFTIQKEIGEILRSLNKYINEKHDNCGQYALLFFILKKIKKYKIADGKQFNLLFDHCEEKIKSLCDNEYGEEISEERYTREDPEARRTKFNYIMPFWVLIACSYHERTEIDYKSKLYNYVLNASNNQMVYNKDKTKIWALAQFLIAISIFQTTQPMYEVFNLGQNIVHQ